MEIFMNTNEINETGKLYKAGKISERTAINKAVEFVALNYKLFGMEKFDEDFKSDVVLKFLEKCPDLLHMYNPEQGDFFGLLYFFVKTIVHTELKTASRKTFNEKIFLETSVENYSEDLAKNFKISHNDLEAKEFPENYVIDQSTSNLRKVFSNLKQSKDRANIILALKSAFYLDDQIIDEICRIYNLNKIEFTDILQICKNQQLSKIERNQKNISRRNCAYFFHKKYSSQINGYNKSDSEEINSTRYQMHLQSRNETQTDRWQKQNKNLRSSKVFIRTSNKLIADILNICERQVSYYVEKTLKSNNYTLHSVESEKSTVN